MTARDVVLSVHAQAYAAPFRNSTSWYVCHCNGGSIIGKAVGEDGAWQDAASWVMRNALHQVDFAAGDTATMLTFRNARSHAGRGDLATIPEMLGKAYREPAP